jgi:hypothetical protein
VGGWGRRGGREKTTIPRLVFAADDARLRGAVWAVRLLDGSTVRGTTAGSRSSCPLNRGTRWDARFSARTGQRYDGTICTLLTTATSRNLMGTGTVCRVWDHPIPRTARGGEATE